MAARLTLFLHSMLLADIYPELFLEKAFGRLRSCSLSLCAAYGARAHARACKIFLSIAKSCNNSRYATLRVHIVHSLKIPSRSLPSGRCSPPPPPPLHSPAPVPLSYLRKFSSAHIESFYRLFAIEIRANLKGIEIIRNINIRLLIDTGNTRNLSNATAKYMTTQSILIRRFN